MSAPLPIYSDASWKCLTATPPAGWQGLGFDDSAWLPAVAQGAWGVAPWGQVPGFVVGTPAQWIWSFFNDGSMVQYFRKAFSGTGGSALTITCDNEFIVWLDGVQVAASKDWTNPLALPLPLGTTTEHVLAVQATNQGGLAGLLVDLRPANLPPPPSNQHQLVIVCGGPVSVSVDGKALS